MSTTPPAAPPTGAVDPKQAAFNALQAVLSSSQTAMNNPANTPEAQEVARSVWNTTNNQLDALDVAVITSDTVSLQVGETSMAAGMTQLKALQTRIAAIGNDMKEGASIVTGITSALTELSALTPL
jgi:hypothetical protein